MLREQLSQRCYKKQKRWEALSIGGWRCVCIYTHHRSPSFPPPASGHTARVLSLTMSPDGATVASAAADETLRLWRCFELDPARRREREKASAAKSSLIHQGIR